MSATRHYSTDEIRLIVSMSSAVIGGRDIEEVLRELRDGPPRVPPGDDHPRPVLSEGRHYVREADTIRYTPAGLRAILQHLS